MSTRFFLVMTLLFAAFTMSSAVLAQPSAKNTNLSRKYGSVVSGGTGNTIPAFVLYGSIGGGAYNTASGYASRVGGGFGNRASQTNATVAGGSYNAATAWYSTVGGGRSNSATGVLSGVGAGGGNQASGDSATVGGGFFNVAGGMLNTIAGGSYNRANGQTAVIGGGFSNEVSSEFYGTIAGGRNNTASGDNATIGGGGDNNAGGAQTTIGGGILNTAGGQLATIGGGGENSASGAVATVSGGSFNLASGINSSVAGGFSNSVSGAFGAVGGGFGNTVTGLGAAVPGGANGRASHSYAFVWPGDKEGPYDYTDSFGDGTFTVRAEGGVRFYTGHGTNTGVFLADNGTQWETLSDSNAKTDFAQINKREVLAKVAALPVTAWHYKHDPKRSYVGPMAQDFHAAFGLGSSDKTIGTLDSDGVMYAAIQGLVEELKDRDAKISELKAKMEAMEERLNSLPPAR